MLYILYIPCGDCEKEYLGQSKRQFGTRLKEHQKAVPTLSKGKSVLAEHVGDTKYEIAWENSKVNTTNIHSFNQSINHSLWSKTMPRSVAYKYEAGAKRRVCVEFNSDEFNSSIKFDTNATYNSIKFDRSN